MSAELLAELARVKAVFQLRAIEAVLGFPRNGTSAFGQEAQRLEAKPAGPVGEADAP